MGEVLVGTSRTLRHILFASVPRFKFRVVATAASSVFGEREHRSRRGLVCGVRICSIVFCQVPGQSRIGEDNCLQIPHHWGSSCRASSVPSRCCGSVDHGRKRHPEISTGGELAGKMLSGRRLRVPRECRLGSSARKRRLQAQHALLHPTHRRVQERVSIASGP